MLLLSHPTGNANVRGAISALEQAEKLSLYQTTVAVHQSDWYFKLLPTAVKQELLRRTYPLPRCKINQHPFRELARLVSLKIGLQFLITHETGWASIDSVYGSLDRILAKQLTTYYKKYQIAGVYCYEDAAIYTFKAAKKLGLTCFYDLPIGYWKMGQIIQQEEAELNPEWSSTLQANFDSADKLARKDIELQMSDVVLVASSFTRQTLQLAPDFKAPVVCIPYGAPCSYTEVVNRHKLNENKLKVLFVGSLSQRKGISYLLDAVEQLGDRAELTLIGRFNQLCSPLEQALVTHRWIASLPHQQVLQEMSHHDVFVFPSLFEGFGLVILEAMAQGLPVITTPHTAGPDIITDGEDGFIVPIRSAEAIAQKLNLLASNRKRLLEMSQAALQKASQYTWKRYGECLVKTIQNYV
ncbi:glycosyltransferase family 4 protein [Chroogloeocystis siderophila]|jgi:starch synthase|uniref:Glycosyl transferase group 1 n=1 Tax=Chroogloeocystis siderophila 5.2 s.c.1 TaxID=247279 RepID=A0A1U7HGD7_9CHRO|nr:glycosyltransferase family 4 protein [Chroogloeocystis siderophila]OKH22662.1 glycosyl transferase group 1 [Chroogloeocystis siderophila 5.2 s.c.1]